MEYTTIRKKIYEVRGHRIMFDFDLAELYEVETRVFNQAIKRNRASFPKDFMFRLKAKEWQRMSSQSVMTYSSTRPKTALPYVFTEHGITMLASVLKSPKARKMNILIVRAFIALQRLAGRHNAIMRQLKIIREKLGTHDAQFNDVYNAIENILDDKVKQVSWKERRRIGFRQ